MSDDPPICPKCNSALVEGCNGRGIIDRVDERCPLHMGTPTDELCEQCHGSGWLLSYKKPCPNMRRKHMEQHLGLELAKVMGVRASPLYDYQAGIDLTNKNIHIHGCPWRNLLPHLKLVVVSKGLNFSHRVYDDERIKNVFVGNENYRNRPLSTRDVLPNFNSVDDLVSTCFDLVIIRLGLLGYKNQAAAGALKEALLFREKHNKPTWLVEDPDCNWTHSNDGDVAFYVEDHFDKVHISPTADPGTKALHELSEHIGFDEEEGLTEPANFTQEAPTHDEDHENPADFGNEEEGTGGGGGDAHEMMNDPMMDDAPKKKGRY